MTDPTPRAVSEEDRHAAAKIVNGALIAAERADAYTDLAVVAALVSHGWGPKPKVDPVVIRSWKPEEILNYLREQGCEVSDGTE